MKTTRQATATITRDALAQRDGWNEAAVTFMFGDHSGAVPLERVRYFETEKAQIIAIAADTSKPLMGRPAS